MGEEANAAGETLDGTGIAAPAETAVHPLAGHVNISHGTCRNCGATLIGPFCATCGQPAHLHRSLHSLGHDILHGAFHFEGKVWRTIPELFFHPGRLTRRYIDGERVKFVSPMALFLFTVFLMFAVFSFTGGMLIDASDPGGAAKVALGPKGLELASRRTQVAEIEGQLTVLQRELADPNLSPQRSAEIKTQIETETANLALARQAVTAVLNGDSRALAEIDKQTKARKDAAELARAEADTIEVQTGSPTLDRRLTAGLQRIKENPYLVLYKLKTNGYKYSWALVPMSIPFLWLLFFWRRDVLLYDHAIFITYSISFVMLLITLCSLASAAGASMMIWGNALAFAPPIHLYAQLRGAYGLSRWSALVRLVLLQIFIVIVLSLYCALLLILGLLD